MMGKKERPAELFAYRVNLDQRVRKKVAGCYGTKGNISVDPEVILRMMLLLFFDDVPSERKLMAIIPERRDHLWFLGYGLDDEIPDHRVLSKARRRKSSGRSRA